jgi:HSP20 family protein
MMNALIPLAGLDEVFESFFGGDRASSGPNGSNEVRHVPYADILEGDKNYLIQLDLPGVDRQSLSIEVENQVLKVTGERTLPVPEGYQARRKELPAKLHFQRSFNLGKEIDAERIGAKLDNGVVTITLPKAEVALPRRIEVK